MDAFERKYRSHGVDVTSEEVFEEPLENIGAKLARQEAAKTTGLAGHGVVLAQSFIDECAKVVAAGLNPVLVSKGIDKTEKALVYELDLMSKGVQPVRNTEAGSMFAEAKRKVSKNSAVVTDEGKSAEDIGNYSEYYIMDGKRVFEESENCKVQPVSNTETGSMIAEAKSKVSKNSVVVTDEGKSAEDYGNYSEYYIMDGKRVFEESENCKVQPVSNTEAGSMIAEAKSKVGKNGVVVTDEGKSAEDIGNYSEYYIMDGKRVFEESENCKVQPVSNTEAGSMIAEAKSKVGKNGVVVIDEGKSTETNVYAVEGIQFDNGNDSEYFITDYERMCVEYDNCKLLLVDHKITNERELVEFMEDVTRGGDPIVIIAEDIEQGALDTLIVKKSSGKWNVASVKAPGGSRELKSQYLDDIAVITGATVIREGDGLTLDKAGKEVLGNARKVVITKEMTTIVGDGTTHEAVSKRVAEIKNLLEQADQGYEKETLNERLAKLSGGVAVIEVGGHSETERREKKIRFEEALNGTKGAVEEAKVDAIKDTLENEEEKVGADIVKKGLSNAGEGGSVVSEKVVRGSLEHAASAAKTFLMSEITVSDAGNPMNFSGWLLR